MGRGERVRAGRAGPESEGDYGAGERRERESAGCGQPKCRDDARLVSRTAIMSWIFARTRSRCRSGVL